MSSSPGRSLRRLAGLALAAALSAASAACATARPNVPRPPGRIDPAELVGVWYVLESNFPMWADGKKTDPAFNYRLLEGEGGPLLDDLVTYREGGEPKSIAG